MDTFFSYKYFKQIYCLGLLHGIRLKQYHIYHLSKMYHNHSINLEYYLNTIVTALHYSSNNQVVFLRNISKTWNKFHDLAVSAWGLERGLEWGKDVAQKNAGVLLTGVLCSTLTEHWVYSYFTAYPAVLNTHTQTHTQYSILTHNAQSTNALPRDITSPQWCHCQFLTMRVHIIHTGSYNRTVCTEQ